MKHIGIGSPVLLLAISVLACISFTIVPSRASADTITSQTSQLLPLGQNTCVPATVGNFTPYIYDGALDSFDFTISDASYVAVVGSVGDTGVPFRYMTRRVDPAAGALRVHVDIDSTQITGTLPISVTLLSSKGPGQPTCATVVRATVGVGPMQTSGGPPIETTGAGSGATNSGGGSTMSGNSGATGSAGNPGTTKPTQGSGEGTAASTSPTKSATTVGSQGLTIGGLCSSSEGSYRLWLGLLIIYAILVGIALWAEFPASVPWMRTPESVAVAILVGLLLLLGFWYFAVACRSEFWMPILAVLIAILGILASFRNHPRLTQLLLMQEAEPQKKADEKKK